MRRLLGVDYGDRRLGLAVSDSLGMIALPLRSVGITSDVQGRDAVAAACKETDAATVVVGMPFNMDGTSGPMAQKVAAFVELLKRALDVPIETWDERLSTQLVERVLVEANMSRQKRKKVRDKLAAQVILQGYMDSVGNGLPSVARRAKEG